ncbi:MAG: hypothetical protein F4X18_05685 [Acidimicrobiia bacterium]|nr:hypothetical protein [bacterium]MYB43694.1 hypothetical protein [Acidimicrobiia bacterium]MYC85000.1 hypothetical protein [Acidimicrobiia bacterium]
MTVLVGLLSPLSIGLADHIGTNVSRRGRLLATVLSIYIFTLLSTLILAVWRGGSPTVSDLVLGACSGVSSGMGLIQLYRGYTTRGTGIVAPVAAVTGAVVPIGVDTIVSGLPSAVVGSGLVVGLIGVWLIGTKDPGAGWDLIALKHGLTSGVMFGITSTLLGLTDDGAGIWPVVPGRVVAVAFVLALILIRREAVRPHRGAIPRSVLAGLLGGIGLGSFTLAAQVNLAVAGLFFQMAFGVTVLFQVLFAGERTTRIQQAGFGVAVVALALIILG